MCLRLFQSIAKTLTGGNNLLQCLFETIQRYVTKVKKDCPFHKIIKLTTTFCLYTMNNENRH